jgi:phosphatidylglycerol lysyltransferase
LAVTCSFWLGLLAYQNVEYSSELWWNFAFHGDAPRFLRGSVGSLAVIALFALRKLLWPPEVKLTRPSAREVEIATPIVKRSKHTQSNVALLGDKQFLFNDDHSGFIMYRVRGRSWVAMGDPVGEPAVRSDLVWSFRELVDRYDGWPVFYQVTAENLPIYLEQGLSLVKLGENARVPLVDFGLAGPARRGLRQTYNRAQRDGCSFEVLADEALPRLLPTLREISDQWLEDKQTCEKSFSLGYFCEEYLRRFPCAVIRQHGQPVAFANLWLGEDREELSVDLMRYSPTAAACVMEYLFIEMMLWGRKEEFRWFNLGMAPLSGIEDRRLAPAWNRAAGLAFRHGDQFFSFQGLRKYKEKFDPVWIPRYLAWPGGWALPSVLADVTRLIAERPSPNNPVGTRRAKRRRRRRRRESLDVNASLSE